MTLTRKLASALCLAFLFITLSSNAQVDSTTGNLINFTGTPTTTTSNWVNGVYVNQLCFQAGQPGNCGPYPSIRASSGNINFSYGQVDLHQIVNINAALAAGGNGVQLSGFNYSFTAKNGNGWDNGQQDYLAAYVKLFGAGGNQVANYDYTSQTNKKYNWTNFNFNETFAVPQLASQYSTAQVGFVGRDTNYWAGNYGPEIMNVSFALKYRVDPCSTNAAYSPTCTGFNNIIDSNNLLNSNMWSQSMYQAAAINVALQNGGIGAQVHGMKYSFDWYVGEQQCTDTFLFWCTGWGNSNVGVNVKMTNANGQAILNRDYTYSGQYVGGRVEDKMLLPSTLNQTALGSVSMQSWGWGDSAAGNFRTQLIYTPDPCVSNPLYSTTCSGYAVAYAKNMLLGSTVASASAPSQFTMASPALADAGPVLAQASPIPDPTQPAQQNTTQQVAQSSPPPAPAQDANQNPSVAQDNPAQPSPQQAGPAPTTPQPAGGPPQTTTATAPSQSSGPGGGRSAGPSKLAMSVVKSVQANDKATQQMAVQNAAKTLEGSMQSSQASSNLAISMNQDMSANSATTAANFANQLTQTSIQASVQIAQQQNNQTNTQSQQTNKTGIQLQQQQETQQVQVQSTSTVQAQVFQQQETQQVQTQSSTSVVKLLQPQQQDQQQTQNQMSAGMMQLPQNTYTAPVQQQENTQSSQVAVLKPPAQMVLETQQSSSGNGITISRNMFAYNPLISTNNTSMSLPLPAVQFTYQPKLDTKQEVDIPQFEISNFNGVSRAGNPLSEIMMQQKFELMQGGITQPGISVNKNVLPNELAGGIDIASIANVPVGFNAYSFILKDAVFYESKEVYKNQQTVDNVRLLRGLTGGSDAKHQEMVNQQYRLGE